MLRRGVLIWKSVKERSTFCAKNSSYFRQIAIYAFILFLMVSFNFVDEGKHGIGLQIGIAMEWLAVSLTNLGMSEVFKEGLKLQKDVDAVI